MRARARVGWAAQRRRAATVVSPWRKRAMAVVRTAATCGSYRRHPAPNSDSTMVTLRGRGAGRSAEHGAVVPVASALLRVT